VFYVFLLIVAVLGVGLYLLFFFQNVPGAVEERLGRLEPLPEDLGRWKADHQSEEGRAAERVGEVREERMYFDESRGRLLYQVRFLKRDTRDVVRVDPDRVVKRRRIKGG
jgi:hypothetical protein